MSNTNPARGMRDFLPVDIRRREYVINIIKSVYESYGFEPLETPAVENIETLTGKYGEEGNQLIYKILKRGEGATTGEADLALRYDLTVPLARVVANHKNDLPRFFKRYQIQPVWRADRPARGRFREFYQCDVDEIGSSSMIVEAELCAAIAEILEKLGFDPFVIKINHRKLLTGILESVEISSDRHIDALIILDKYDKIGEDALIDEFERKGFSLEFISKMFDFFKTVVDYRLEELNKPTNSKIDVNNKILDVLDDFIGNHKIGKEGLDELKSIVNLSKNTWASQNILIDPLLARGLSYYTGAIMEVDVGKEIGSLGGGGRYDGLIGMFGKEQIPACGFSLGLERILVVMDERNMFPADLQNASAQLLVTIWNGETIAESLKLANELRAQGLRVLVYPETDKLGKQFKYADSINIPFVCVLGESELAENKVTLKNMQTGEQETIAREEIKGKISK